MSKENSTAAAAAAAAEELPRTIVRRVVKDKLSQVSGDGGEVILHKEALIAFSESARIFIHYLSATANDICSESKRQIINAEDVLKALEEIEFSEFVEPLREALDEYKKKAAGKRAGAAKTKEDNKKRKTEKETTLENGGGKGVKSNGDNVDEFENQASEGGEQASDEGGEQASDEGGEQASDEGGEQASDEEGEQASEGSEEPGTDSHDS